MVAITRTFGAEITNNEKRYDDALPLKQHKQISIPLAAPNLVSGGLNPWGEEQKQEALKNLRIQYNEKLQLNKQKKALREQGPPAIFNPSLVTSGLNNFTAAARQQAEFEHFVEFTTVKINCKHANCKASVPVDSAGWCKPCSRNFSAKTDYKQVCNSPGCESIVGAKNQHSDKTFKGVTITNHSKWCKKCRRKDAARPQVCHTPDCTSHVGRKNEHCDKTFKGVTITNYAKWCKECRKSNATK